MKRAALTALSIAIILTGCVHHTPFKDEYYFQSLGKSGEMVVTADLDKVRESTYASLLPDRGPLDYALDRSNRLSLSLIPKRTDIYPLPFEYYEKAGALEGNLGKFPVNTALSLSKDFHKEKDGDVKYYTNDNISLAVAKNGILLFSDGSYKEFYDRTIENRAKLIDDDIAAFMADSLFALFLNSPETLIDLGFELPQSVVTEINTSYLGFSEIDGALVLSGALNMKSKSSARALSTLLRNQLLQDAKRSGEKVDLKALSAYFNYNEDVVTIAGYPLKGDMANRANDTLNKALEGFV